ncbi:hypothetical protein [Komagataeibacter saccharivorans]|uniref:hypothetical protein n=1 Tax=Komagataeibacter saccharivorans TaxID=265959 RepID=UPI0020B120AA|nr:hypothetical protein [Komagataeibacter saccharivorans]
MFTVNEECKTLEICDELKGSIYSDLHGKKLSTPVYGLPPSKENIAHHRKRFRKRRMRGKKCRRRNVCFEGNEALYLSSKKKAKADWRVLA